MRIQRVVSQEKPQFYYWANEGPYDNSLIYYSSQGCDDDADISRYKNQAPFRRSTFLGARS
jgi:hypothetical protein